MSRNLEGCSYVHMKEERSRERRWAKIKEEREVREKKRERRAHGRHPRDMFRNWHNLQRRLSKLGAFMQKK